MKNIILAALGLLGLIGSAQAQTPPFGSGDTNVAMWCLNSGGTAWIPAQDTVHCAGSGGGGGAVTITQTTPGTTNGVAIVGVNAATQLAGAGAVGTGSERVAVGQDITTIAGSAPGTAGTASANVLTVQGIASMTPLFATLQTGSAVVGKTDTDAANPTSTLTLTSATTAYTAGQLIASSATAGSVVVPSFSMTNTTGIISRLRLTNNDATSTAYGAQTIQVDLWSAAPTFTNGDRGTFAVATGSAGHLGAFTCVISAETGDGVYSECAPVVGNYALLKLGASTVYWTLDALTGSGVTGASKVWTLTAEVLN